jgi:cytochrome c oxidase assembly factor CtaG
MAEALLSGWAWAPAPAISLVIMVIGYVWAAVRVDHLQPSQPWPSRYTMCFLAGVGAIWLAILGPPGYFDDTFFYAHMAQHILLTMVAAPLVILGNPVLLALRAASRTARRHWLLPVLHSRFVRVVTNPLVGWIGFVTVMVVSHVPAVYDYALDHPYVHDYVEHPAYVVSALVYFYPLLTATSGRRPIAYGFRALSLFTMMVPMAFVGFFIYAAPHVDYSFYVHVTRPFGPGPLEDQQLSGALMWSSGMIFGAIWFCVVGLRWLQAEERRAHSVDRAVARSITSAHETPRPGLSS